MHHKHNFTAWKMFCLQVQRAVSIVVRNVRVGSLIDQEAYAVYEVTRDGVDQCGVAGCVGL